MIWLTWRQFRAPATMMTAALAAVLGLTGPGLADDYSTGIAACTTQSGGCSAFVHRFFQDHQDPSSVSPPSCWSCPPSSGSSGEHR
jgi:hypothetical protein